jgi:hypothetical protein
VSRFTASQPLGEFACSPERAGLAAKLFQAVDPGRADAILLGDPPGGHADVVVGRDAFFQFQRKGFKAGRPEYDSSLSETQSGEKTLGQSENRSRKP